MKGTCLLFSGLVVLGGAWADESTRVTDEASAIAAAKRYTKAQCKAEAPCSYRARREGKQWNVFVELPKRSDRREVTNRYPGGHVILYFNPEGQLVRRIQGE